MGRQDISGAGILIERWNGTNWSIVPGPQFSQAMLFGVAALSPNDAWAVGTYDDISSGSPLMLHWDGAAWAHVPVPNPAPDPGQDARLRAITAVGGDPNDIWAVGDYFAYPNMGSFIEHWDGVQWSLVYTDSAQSILKGVSAQSPNDVWAVGEIRSDGGQTRTFITHWDGVQWATIPSPNPGTSNYLNSVAAISANDVWAVGQSDGRGLTMHWDGSAWSVVPVPTVPGDTMNLHEVAGRASDDVWAVGNYGIFPGIRTIALHWDGTRWEHVYTPSISQTDARLYGLALAPDGSAWAAGYFGSDSDTSTRALVERYRPDTCCGFNLMDVQSTDYFYEGVRHLFCNGAISGYGDNTFRPYNNATRGQLTKIVVLARGWPIVTTGGPHFTDVPPSNPFYSYIETAYNRGIISGYQDGTFRWANDITRAQLCKVVIAAMGWPIDTSYGPHFSDVPPSHTFYSYIETAYNRGIITGYHDGTFRPGNNATRGQIGKIVYSAIVQP